MNKYILIFTLYLLICIAGCAAPPTETAPPTVADLFDNTATTPSEELDAPDAAMVSLGFGLMGDFVTDETNRRLYLYHGGEMRLGYWMEAEGYSNMGLGIFLFVDGLPQPFKTESDGTERYMHILYPPEGEKITGQFLFTPASGEQDKNQNRDQQEFHFAQCVLTIPPTPSTIRREPIRRSVRDPSVRGCYLSKPHRVRPSPFFRKGYCLTASHIQT